MIDVNVVYCMSMREVETKGGMCDGLYVQFECEIWGGMGWVLRNEAAA